ncbi:hypothetical protein Tco_0529282 [Tanacetum coccineum]
MKTLSKMSIRLWLKKEVSLRAFSLFPSCVCSKGEVFEQTLREMPDQLWFGFLSDYVPIVCDRDSDILSHLHGP